MKNIKNKKFSSFKKQQMLFEGWRDFCIDNGAEQKSNYILLFEGANRYPEKKDFSLLLEDMRAGNISHAKFLRLWERSVDYEINSLLEEGLLDTLSDLKNKAKDKVADIAQKVIKKIVPVIMNLLGTAISYIQSFMSKIASMGNEASIKFYVAAQSKITSILVKGMQLSKKVEPYIGPVLRVMCGIGILTVAFGGLSASANTGGSMDPDILNAAMSAAVDCYNGAGGYEGMDPEFTARVVETARDVASDEHGVVSKSTDFAKVFERVGSDKTANLCIDAAEEFQVALRSLESRGNTDMLDAAQGKLRETTQAMLQQAEALRETDPEAFSSAAETGKKIEILSNTSIESIDKFSSQSVTTTTTDASSGQVLDKASDFSREMKTWLTSVTKKFPHVKGTPLPDLPELEIPVSAIETALEKDPDLLSQGESEIKKAVLDAARELGREDTRIVSKVKRT
jgi:hypothetical protein